MSGLALPPLFHVGIVVADMERASADFERRWNVPTEHVIELAAPGALYRGRIIDLVARYGFLRTGASEIELIQPVSAESPYRDFLAEHGEGMHHLAYTVDRIQPYLDRLEEHGELDVVLDAALPGGGRFVYLDGVAHGAVVELIQTAD